MYKFQETLQYLPRFTLLGMIMQQLFQELKNSLIENVPYTNLFDFSVLFLDANKAEIKFDMQQKLVGNILNGGLHGGATATVFDSVGGLLAMYILIDRTKEAGREACIAKLAKTSTVNMHINYLAPGRGEFFLARASCLQAGSRLVRTNMQLFNDKESLIAESTATYLIG